MALIGVCKSIILVVCLAKASVKALVEHEFCDTCFLDTHDVRARTSSLTMDRTDIKPNKTWIKIPVFSQSSN